MPFGVSWSTWDKDRVASLDFIWVISYHFLHFRKGATHYWTWFLRHLEIILLFSKTSSYTVYTESLIILWRDIYMYMIQLNTFDITEKNIYTATASAPEHRMGNVRPRSSNVRPRSSNVKAFVMNLNAGGSISMGLSHFMSQKLRHFPKNLFSRRVTHSPTLG